MVRLTLMLWDVGVTMYKHLGWHTVEQRTHNSSQGLPKMMHLYLPAGQLDSISMFLIGTYFLSI